MRSETFRSETLEAVEPYRLRVVHQDVLARGGCLDLIARRRPVLQPEDILRRDLGVDECVLANTGRFVSDNLADSSQPKRILAVPRRRSPARGRSVDP